MSEAAVSIAVGIIRDLLVEEAKFLSGVTNQVQEVGRELKRMQCFLRDADTRENTDETIRNWLREIKALTYRAEDVVETFAVEVASKRGKGVKKVLKRLTCLFCEGRSLHNIGLEIEQVKTDISNLTASLESYNVKSISEGESESSSSKTVNYKWARQTYAHEDEEYFVGMEEDIRKLVLLLVGNQRHHSIISIWGMGGLGKTTIARKIYKHGDVQRCFVRFAWVCITQNAQIRGILEDILMQFFPEKKEEVKNMEERELVQLAYRVQKEIKCLVVLDDIWSMLDWENLSHAFPVVGGNSKILLTTRTEEVAKIGFSYQLRCLTEGESWDLLKNIAFSRKTTVEDLKIEPKLEAVGIKMVRKCGCLPLAISVLGGILKDKDSLNDWISVNENIDLFLNNGDGSEERSDGRAVARVLSLSYDVLPYHLKPCFLYLGSFREDENINVEQLFLLWIGEGMVSSQHRRSGETLMDVAERYLNELRQRSMVQVPVDELSSFRRFSSCHLHDMMREFCLKKVKEDEFIEVIDFRGIKKTPLDSFSLGNDVVNRLVIHINGEVEAPAHAASLLEDYKQLRSLIFRNSEVRVRGKKIIWQKEMINYENFKSLRVLKFEGYDFGGQKLPEGLGKLIHLRLLSLKFCILGELPSSIFNLPFLQTLDLRVLFGFKIPNVLGKTKRLRHLYLSTTPPNTGEVREKLRLHGLGELEILDGFNSLSHEIGDLQEFSNLRSLNASVADNKSLSIIIDHMSTIWGNLNENMLAIREPVSFSSEDGNVVLRKILLCGNLHFLSISATIIRFPPYEEHFLQGLVELNLARTQIHEDPMQTFEKLPQLRLLKLLSESYVGKELICHEFGFPQLRHLYLFSLPNLLGWRVDKGAMPNLSSLEISKCSVLEMIPDGLKYVAGLKALTVDEMPFVFVNRIKVVDGREGEDFDKIRHIPSVTIRRPHE